MIQHFFCEDALEFEEFVFYLLPDLLECWSAGDFIVFIELSEFSEQVVVSFKKSDKKLSAFCFSIGKDFLFDVFVDSLFYLFCFLFVHGGKIRSKDGMLSQITEGRNDFPVFFDIL